MLLPLHDRLRLHLATLVSTTFALDPASVPDFPLEYPPNRTLGDLGTPLAFDLARRLRKAPRAIAQELAAGFGTLAGIASVSPAPNGYLNVFLERPTFLIDRVRGRALPRSTRDEGKAIVEHTAINPNKAAHIGHMRNSVLGDTLVRALRFQGVPVEIQNYIDDTGVQVADVVVGLHAIQQLSLEQVRHIADTTRFDYYCWDLYARVTEWYEADQSRLEIRERTLHDIERGGNEKAAIASLVADRIVRCHLATMARMNVDYDLLTWEGDILRLEFWARAFELLKDSGAVYLQGQGRLAGCWVMPIHDDAADEAGDASDDAENREKVIVRSNGVVTYVGKDIAYQFWKLGLLGRDFHYRHFCERPDGPLWATCSDGGVADHPAFGQAVNVFNVIDVRQSYLQKLLKQALIALGQAEAAGRSHHFSYEMVALSHATARELGYAPPTVAEGGSRSFVEVSGRKGQGVKADDLLDTLVAKAGREVASRNPELSSDQTAQTAQMIGIAALRYFMVKFSRGKVIVFDLDEALSFEGESGPYIQYAVVRANNILRKLAEREGIGEEALLAELDQHSPSDLNGEDGNHELWSLVLEAARLDEIVDQVIRSLEFSVLAKYAFGLAQAFNAFYHRAPILAEERPATKRWRAAGVCYVRNQLTLALELMGVSVPSRM